METMYYVQNVHVLLGGIRLRQIRLRPQECSLCANAAMFGGEAWKGQCSGSTGTNFDFEGRDCFESGDLDRESVSFVLGNETVEYEYRDGAELNDQEFSGMFSEYPGGGFVEDLPLNLSESMAMIENLEAMQWIDGSTLLVTLDFNTYYPSESLHTVTRLFWEMPASGVFSRYEIKTWKFDRYSGDNDPGIIKTWMVVANLQLVIMMFLGMMTWTQLQTLCRCICSGRCGNRCCCKKSGKGKGESVWDATFYLDLCILVAFWLSFALFVHNWYFEEQRIEMFRASAPFQSFRRLQYFFEWEVYCLALSGMLYICYCFGGGNKWMP